MFDPDVVAKGNSRRLWVNGLDIKDSVVEGGGGGVWCAVGIWRSSVSAMLVIVAAVVPSPLFNLGALILLVMSPLSERARAELECPRGFGAVGEIAGV